MNLHKFLETESYPPHERLCNILQCWNRKGHLPLFPQFPCNNRPRNHPVEPLPENHPSSPSAAVVVPINVHRSAVRCAPHLSSSPSLSLLPAAPPEPKREGIDFTLAPKLTASAKLKIKKKSSSEGDVVRDQIGDFSLKSLN